MRSRERRNILVRFCIQRCRSVSKLSSKLMELSRYEIFQIRATKLSSELIDVHFCSIKHESEPHGWGAVCHDPRICWSSSKTRPRPRSFKVEKNFSWEKTIFRKHCRRSLLKVSALAAFKAAGQRANFLRSVLNQAKETSEAWMLPQPLENAYL